MSDTSSLMVKGPEISPELWTGSRRPWRGWLLRSGAALTVATAGLFVPVPAASYALLAAAVVVFFAIPLYVLRLRLPRLAGEVDALSDKRAAQALQTRIREDFWVEQFAPSAWLPLQEARIQLVLEDGRAAARHFAEVARLGRAEDPKRRVEAARGHALLMAGDRKEAMAIFDALAERDVLEPIDELALGIVLLSEPARLEDAGRYLSAAHEALGDEYRVLAALALARERLGAPERANELVDRAAELEAAGLERDDALASDLLKRAKKGLRPWLRAQDKREKKKGRRRGKDKSARATGTSSTPPGEDEAESAADEPTDDELAAAKPDGADVDSDGETTVEADTPKKKKRKGKKARQQERREARKRKKAEERARKHEQTQLRIAAAKAGADEASATDPSADGPSPAGSQRDRTSADSTPDQLHARAGHSSVPTPPVNTDDAEKSAAAVEQGIPSPAAPSGSVDTVERRPLAASSSTSGAAIPRPPALGFGGGSSADAPRPFAAPKVPGVAKAPPPSGSLFGGLDVPKPSSEPSRAVPSKAATSSADRPIVPEPAVTKPTAVEKAAGPAQPTIAPATKPAGKPAAPPASVPFPDDLFAPPTGTASPPSVTAPVVPPPPMLGGAAGPAPKPSSAVDDAWGDLFDGPPAPGGPAAPKVEPPKPVVPPTIGDDDDGS